MTTKQAILGVQQIKSKKGLDVETVLGRLGLNSGNMMFTESLSNILPNSKLISWQITNSEIEDCDCIIIAAANWLATGTDLAHLADKLEKIHLPVLLVGIGAQSRIDKEIPKLSDGTLRFLSIVSERSKNISTRGRFTSTVLEHYGFNNTVTTGCPSLLLTGSDGPQFKKHASPDRVVIHGTRHRYNSTDEFQNYIFMQAFRLGSDILLQSETPDIIISQGLDIPENSKALAIDVLTKSYGCSSFDNISNYLKEHGHFFSDYKSWVDYNKTRSFCLGTRIHGTIASIIAETPALLIAHDSRTEELAQVMGVPFVLESEIDRSRPLDLSELVNAFESKKNLFNYSEYRSRFKKFFDANGIFTSI